mmetsp:Transcript_7990/g.11876  ORF Transcript_7990/g.11876 Transcript_7990/m.11876 type:complete len:814 (+) Transcript_7990:61-2502(+)
MRPNTRGSSRPTSKSSSRPTSKSGSRPNSRPGSRRPSNRSDSVNKRRNDSLSDISGIPSTTTDYRSQHSAYSELHDKPNRKAKRADELGFDLDGTSPQKGKNYDTDIVSPSQHKSRFPSYAPKVSALQYNNAMILFKHVADEIHMQRIDRELYYALFMKNQTPQNFFNLCKLIAYMQRHKRLTAKVMSSIHEREDVMNRLRECETNYVDGKKTALYTQNKGIRLLQQLQLVSLEVIESIAQWRQTLSRPYPYMYRYMNYIKKLKQDCVWLDACDISFVLPMKSTANPLLSPFSGFATMPIKAFRLKKSHKSKKPLGTNVKPSYKAQGMINKALERRLVEAERMVLREVKLQRELKQHLKQLLFNGYFVPMLQTVDIIANCFSGIEIQSHFPPEYQYMLESFRESILDEVDEESRHRHMEAIGQSDDEDDEYTQNFGDEDSVGVDIDSNFDVDIDDEDFDQPDEEILDDHESNAASEEDDHIQDDTLPDDHFKDDALEDDISDEEEADEHQEVKEEKLDFHFDDDDMPEFEENDISSPVDDSQQTHDPVTNQSKSEHQQESLESDEDNNNLVDDSHNDDSHNKEDQDDQEGQEGQEDQDDQDDQEDQEDQEDNEKLDVKEDVKVEIQEDLPEEDEQEPIIDDEPEKQQVIDDDKEVLPTIDDQQKDESLNDQQNDKEDNDLPKEESNDNDQLKEEKEEETEPFGIIDDLEEAFGFSTPTTTETEPTLDAATNKNVSTTYGEIDHMPPSLSSDTLSAADKLPSSPTEDTLLDPNSLPGDFKVTLGDETIFDDDSPAKPKNDMFDEADFNFDVDDI